ncbi:MAG: hypothetical protein R3A10_05830 [Caldilineaceae bacterium]
MLDLRVGGGDGRLGCGQVLLGQECVLRGVEAPRQSAARQPLRSIESGVRDAVGLPARSRPVKARPRSNQSSGTTVVSPVPDSSPRVR